MPEPLLEELPSPLVKDWGCETLGENILDMMTTIDIKCAFGVRTCYGDEDGVERLDIIASEHEHVIHLIPAFRLPFHTCMHEALQMDQFGQYLTTLALETVLVM